MAKSVMLSARASDTLHRKVSFSGWRVVGVKKSVRTMLAVLVVLAMAATVLAGCTGGATTNTTTTTEKP
jgi:hypothetical protein